LRHSRPNSGHRGKRRHSDNSTISRPSGDTPIVGMSWLTAPHEAIPGRRAGGLVVVPIQLRARFTPIDHGSVDGITKLLQGTASDINGGAL